MSKYFFFVLFLFSINAQIMKIGTTSSDLSEYKSEVFDPGIMFGIGFEIPFNTFYIDLEAQYISNNYISENESFHHFMQYPISFRIPINNNFFIRTGIQYDQALNAKIFNDDISKYINDGLSIILGFGYNINLLENNQIFIEARYNLPTYNYLTIDKNDTFGKLRQLQLSCALKL